MTRAQTTAKYTIGQFAALTGLTIKALRHYHDVGILCPISVDTDTGYRRYSADQLADANRVMAMRDAGVLLADLTTATALRRTRTRLIRRIRDDVNALRRIEAMLSDGLPAIALKDQPPMRVALLRRRLSNFDDVNVLLDELLKVIPKRAQGLVSGSLWSDCNGRSADCTAFIALRQSSYFIKGAEIETLPRTRVATLLIDGRSNDAFDCGYRTLNSWIREMGYGLNGPKAEWYLSPLGSGSSTLAELRFPV